ncbi:MAG: flagellar basal body L-ring protein FlgH [Bacteriovoracaceae bacterium]|nr:flagellar basal body L-ring protein FlgH [Bacteriovoracaceae bacterium]
MSILKLLLVFSLLFSVSCASYINRIHKEMDRDSRKTIKRQKRDKFALYRKRSRYKDRYRNQKRISSKKFQHLSPSIKRNYRSKSETKKRYTAHDLDDNSASGSLWAGSGKDSYLFSSEQKKQNGDIVIINVLKNLKDQIAVELKRAFPVSKRKKKDAKVGAAKVATTTTQPKPVAEKTDGENKNETQVFDKISGIVIEQINREHLLLMGRKDVIYHNKKRTIGIQALVARNSITNNNTVSSSQILESHIEVIR